MKQKQQLLLLKDVDGLGRSGDVVNAKPGYVRNFLLPKKLAEIASEHTLLKQAKLKEERSKLALVDRKASEEMAEKLTNFTLSTTVKVDPEGNLYGSVTSHDIAEMLKREGYEIERKAVALPQPIKSLGKHQIPLRLKEGVMASFTLEVNSEEEKSA